MKGIGKKEGSGKKIKGGKSGWVMWCTNFCFA